MFTNFMGKIIDSIPDFHWAIAKIKWYLVISDRVKIKQTHLFSLLIIFIFICNYDSMKSSKFFRLYQFHIVFFAFLSLFSEVMIVYDRLYFYLLVFEPILVYEFRILFKEKKIFDYLIIFFIAIMSLFTVFIWGPRNFLTPYEFLK